MSQSQTGPLSERPHRAGPSRSRAGLAKATRALKAGRFEVAKRACEKVLAREPGNQRALEMLAGIAWRSGDVDAAEGHLRAALAADDDSPQALSRLAQFLFRRGRHEEALPVIERAVALAPESAEFENTLGGVLVELARPEAAVPHFRRAISLDPDFAKAHHNLGAALHDLGGLDEAQACYRRAIALKPDYAAAYRHMSRVKRFTPNDPDVAAMQGLLKAPSLDAGDRVALHFALAKACEDMGEYEPAFEHLIQANQGARRRITYSIDEDMGKVTRLMGAFDRAAIGAAAGAGFASELPIFIVGMPRTGTTLVEQILASHPEVAGAGELRDLGLVDGQIKNWLEPGCTEPFPECLGAIRREAWQALGAAYVEGLEVHRRGAARVTDKMPFNFNWVGLIHMMLPKAAIVHVTRDPLDTCLSCYKQQFVEGSHFSYDLTELGRYYHCCYRRITAHWRAVLPGRVFDLHYEDLVRDPEPAIAALLDHCGLPWSDACLGFHKTERSVQTASAAQVRQPLYASSVALWRRYERQLEPLRRALDRPCTP